MKKILALFIILIGVVGLLSAQSSLFKPVEIVSGAPPYDPEGGNVPEDADFSWLNNWKRPEGPAKVALQVGHWKNEEVPEELHRLRGNTGATGGGKSEWEVNYVIAEKTAELLRTNGVEVEILPATVPPQYWADVFISIHADGSTDSSKSGYKIAAPRRDRTGKAAVLVGELENSYEDTTGLIQDPYITRNMTGYYAFSWWRYEHAVHPMTTSAIVETGFLTNPSDRTIIVSNSDLSAKGIAEGILQFLKNEKLLK